MRTWIRSIEFIMMFALLMMCFQSALLSTQEWNSTRFSFQEEKYTRIIQSGHIEHSPIFITDNDGFKALEIAGNGTPINPYLIEGYIFNNTDISWLIHIIDTDVHFIFRKNLLHRPYGNDSGIYLRNVTHATISDNKIINTTIFASQSWNNTISNNLLIDHSSGRFYKDGIDISSSNDCQISNNTLENYYNGVELWDSRNNSVFNNTVSNSHSSAITVYYSSHNEIINNTIGYNSDDGIHCAMAENNTIMKNLIYYNRRYGVYFHNDTNNHTVRQNDFLAGYYPDIVNNFATFDNGTNNRFLSNYYADWDGSGDYSTQGFAGSKDTSPLLNPYHLTPPIITSPTSGTILKDMVTIHWTQSIDSFNHSLSYSIFYSDNFGVTWIEINTDLTTLSSTWDISTIANGTIILLKVQVMDSLGYQSFSIPDTFFIIESPVLITSSLPASFSSQEYITSSSIIPKTTTQTTTTSVATPFLGIISIIMVTLILGLFRLDRNLRKN